MADRFEFAEFEKWYDDHCRRYLEPARLAAAKALDEFLDERFRERDRLRIRVTPGRVKRSSRVWQKLNLDSYANEVRCVDDIPRVIDDLVGLRLVCTNDSDARGVFELLRGLDRWVDGTTPVLAVEQSSERDYVSDVKPSGYRALHINLFTSVNIGMQREVVRCELQIRTLLQDSWGELTHEDTYKPGGAIPPLVDTLSRRMADLLSTLDDLAQDVRDELDRLSEEAVESELVGDRKPVVLPSEQLVRMHEAVAQFLRRRIELLDAPIDLASLAWEVQREFGQGVIDGWLGHGSFKHLLVSSVENLRISSVGPSFVVPAGHDFLVPDKQPSAKSNQCPPAISVLKNIDRGLPILATEEWKRHYRWLASALALSATDRVVDIAALNSITRLARDEAKLSDVRVARANLDYIGKSLMFNKLMERGMSAEAVATAFADSVIKRVGDVFEVDDHQRLELRAWLGAD
jgi:ppGpp synthetase/RelA/SpoT-type nucleotidyltranferase